MIPWRVYYDDGSTFEGAPEDAPKVGVQVVAQFGMSSEKDGVGFIYGRDYYCWIGDDPDLGWSGCDLFGLWEYLASPGAKVVLFGRTIATADFREIVDRAVRECRELAA